MSAYSLESDRTIIKKDFISSLKNQKSLLITKWTLEALDTKSILKGKREYLESYFSLNPPIRAFIFSDEFLNKNNVIEFIHEYLDKYYKKPKLQKPPIFIFGENSDKAMQEVIKELYKYQRIVNNGSVGDSFNPDSFINNTTCASDFVCKVASLKDISIDILEKCMVNQVYVIGAIDKNLSDKNYFIEELDVQNVSMIKYLVGLSKIWRFDEND